jgi:hypothetical protein
MVKLRMLFSSQLGGKSYHFIIQSTAW